MHFDMAAILAAMSNRSMDQKTLQASMHLKKISRTTAVPYIVFQWALGNLPTLPKSLACSACIKWRSPLKHSLSMMLNKQ